MTSNALDSHGSSPEIDEQPVSRTYQYRKVMKPLLERKRRARINKCLDELKDTMVSALQSEGESITKMEKADVLELTARHLQKLKRQHALGLTPAAAYARRFREGYSACAAEISRFLIAAEATPGVIDPQVSARLLAHLSNCIRTLEQMPPSMVAMSGSPNPPPPLVGGAPPLVGGAPPRLPGAYTPPASPSSPLDFTKNALHSAAVTYPTLFPNYKPEVGGTHQKLGVGSSMGTRLHPSSVSKEDIVKSSASYSMLQLEQIAKAQRAFTSAVSASLATSTSDCTWRPW